MSTSVQTAVVRPFKYLVGIGLVFAPVANSALLLDAGIGTRGGNTIPAFQGLGRSISVSENTAVTLDELRLYFDAEGSAGDVTITFVLYNHNDHTTLLASRAVTRTDVGAAWYSSGVINWVLQPGQRYDIGARTTESSYFYRDTIYESANGLTANAGAPQFSTAGVTSHGTGDGAMQLYGTVSAVPEPTTIALSIFAGMFGIGALVRHLRLRKA